MQVVGFLMGRLILIKDTFQQTEMMSVFWKIFDISPDSLECPTKILPAVLRFIMERCRRDSQLFHWIRFMNPEKHVALEKCINFRHGLQPFQALLVQTNHNDLKEKQRLSDRFQL